MSNLNKKRRIYEYPIRVYKMLLGLIPLSSLIILLVIVIPLKNNFFIWLIFLLLVSCICVLLYLFFTSRKGFVFILDNILNDDFDLNNVEKNIEDCIRKLDLTLTKKRYSTKRIILFDEIEKVKKIEIVLSKSQNFSFLDFNEDWERIIIYVYFESNKVKKLIREALENISS